MGKSAALNPGSWLDSGFVVKTLVVVVGYAALGLLAMHGRVLGGELARAVWPASALAVAAVVFWGLRMWVAVVVGEFVTTLLTSGSIAYGLATAVGNGLEVVIAGLLLVRVVNLEPALERVQDVLGLTVLTAFVAPLISATIGAATLPWTVAPDTNVAVIWWRWWLSHALAIAAITPFVLTWWRFRPRRVPRRRAVGATGLAVAVLVVSEMVFGDIPVATEALAYLPFPVLIWAAFSFGQRGASAALLVISTAALIATARDVGPFAGGQHSLDEQLLLTWAFVNGATVTTLLLGAIVTQRRRLEDQLLQSQKLEAIGRLAGGVAHDFNNLLTTIFGHTELVRDTTVPGSGAAMSIDQIERAAARGADLTRQLLAFARKQIIAPRVIVLNDLVINHERMLRRVIGEDIQLRTQVSTERWCVKVDPIQLEQVILNLVINARDAMPDGGTLTIRSYGLNVGKRSPIRGLDPGAYLVLEVEDDGAGMDAETLTQVFEPFFTTKDRSKGTGLGLAMVYGAVKQAGGHVAVRSDVGVGTTFTIYLPRVDAPPDDPGNGDGHRPQAIVQPGRETVLVVEDEPMVLDMVRETLQALQYNVLSAVDGEDALHVAASHPGPIDLALTDVVLPILNGKEMATRLGALHPETRVLFMSGYSEEQVSQHGDEENPSSILSKPFTPDRLVDAVRATLDRD